MTTDGAGLQDSFHHELNPEPEVHDYEQLYKDQVEKTQYWLGELADANRDTAAANARLAGIMDFIMAIRDIPSTEVFEVRIFRGKATVEEAPTAEGIELGSTERESTEEESQAE